MKRPITIEGSAQQNVVDEAHDHGEPRILAVFRQIGSRQHAERGSDSDADYRHYQASDDRIQKTAGAAGRGRIFRENGNRQPPNSFPEQHHENHEQPDQADGGGGNAEAHPDRATATPRRVTRRDGVRGHRRYLPAWISRRISMILAIASTTKVIMNRISPRAISDEV